MKHNIIWDAKMANSFWMDSFIFGPKDKPKNRSDFGGPGTVNMHLRRIGLSFNQLSIETDFGIFLGDHGDSGWVVAIKDMNCKLIGIEKYDTLGELQQHWELD